MTERAPQSVRDLLPQVPEGIVVITGDEAAIFDTWKTFSNVVMNYLGIIETVRGVFVKEKPLVFRLPNDRDREVDDAAIYLIVKDLPVASVTAIRNQGNFVQGLFASYLTPQWEEKVRARLHNHSNENIYYSDDPFSSFS